MGLERKERIAGIWADAFELDPLMVWVFPDEAKRRESLRQWWGFLLDRMPAGAELHGTRADGCVAYWQPPIDEIAETTGHDHESEEMSDWAAEFAALMHQLLGDLALARLEALGTMHQARLTSPHWYLSVLGTLPSQQSKGLGARVLAPMLSRCDRIGEVAYLESTNPANVGFYRRYGFEPIGEFEVGDGVLITPMAREPRAPEQP